MSRYWDSRGSSGGAVAMQQIHLRVHMEWLAAQYNRGVMVTSDGQPTKDGIEWLRRYPKVADTS